MNSFIARIFRARHRRGDVGSFVASMTALSVVAMACLAYVSVAALRSSSPAPSAKPAPLVASAPGMVMLPSGGQPHPAAEKTPEPKPTSTTKQHRALPRPAKLTAAIEQQTREPSVRRAQQACRKVAKAEPGITANASLRGADRHDDWLAKIVAEWLRDHPGWIQIQGPGRLLNNICPARDSPHPDRLRSRRSTHNPSATPSSALPDRARRS